MVLLLKILWRKSFCWIFVSVPASNSLFNSASLYSLSGSSTLTLWRGRRKRSYLGKLPFLFQFCLHFKLFFWCISFFWCFCFSSCQFGFWFDSSFASLFFNCLVVVWLLSVLVTFEILLNFWRSRGWLVDMRAALT
jgi:hypothetical protein